MKHYFMTLPDVVFPENRFCAKCGEYFTHTNHLHGRDCQCKTCQQERLLTKRAADECPHCHKTPLIAPVSKKCAVCGLPASQRR